MPSVLQCPACGQKNRVPDAAVGRPRCANCHTDLPWLIDVGDAGFADAVENSLVPVLVDIWAPWCGPCRMVTPIVEQLAEERAGRLKVAKVNSDTSPAVSARHRVTSIPTLLIYSGGKEVGRQVGALPAPQLRSWVDAVLSRT